MGLLQQINQMEIFKHFTDQDRKLFFGVEQAIEEYHEGDVIIMEGDNNDSLYLLLKGRVTVTKSGYDYVVNELGAGEVFGEMSFLSKKPRYNNVIAAEKCIAIRMDGIFFEQVGSVVREKIKDYLIELLVSRLDEMNASLVKVFPNAWAA